MQNLVHSLSSPWFVGPVVFVAWCVGLTIIMRILYGRLHGLATRTATDIDDVIVGALRVPVALVILVTGGLILARILPLSPDWDRGLNLGVRIVVILAGVLLFLFGCLLMYWLLNRNQLMATPKKWTGRVGSRVEFQVKKWGLLWRTDVSGKAVPVAGDPRVIRFDHFGSPATARSPGKTLVHFYLGDKSTAVTVTVAAADPPERYVEGLEGIRVDAGARVAHRKLDRCQVLLARHDLHEALFRELECVRGEIEQHPRQRVRVPLPVIAIRRQQSDR